MEPLPLLGAWVLLGLLERRMPIGAVVGHKVQYNLQAQAVRRLDKLREIRFAPWYHVDQEQRSRQN
jgi:hypothetical protein